MAVANLVPHEDNPRKISKKKLTQLAKSLKEDPEFFEARPIICSDRTDELVILGGNQRYRAAVDAGFKEVPVTIISGLTEDKERAIVIKDNTSSGEWDWEALQDNWMDLPLDDWGLEVPESKMVDDGQAHDDNYDVPDKLKVTVKEGDIYHIGEHILMCGSSTLAANWKKVLGSLMVDLVVTDPPYNIDYQGATKDKLKIENDNMSDKQFYQFLLDFYSALNKHVKPGGVWYVWHADSVGNSFRKAFDDAGIVLRQCLIWVKNQFTLGRQDYPWRHEPCLYGHAKGEVPEIMQGEEMEEERNEAEIEISAYRQQHESCLYGWKDGKAHVWANDRRQSTILEFDKPKRNAEHPTMKPVELIGYQIKNSSRRGEIVADGFLGSGTTMVAAHQLRRVCIGFELDPKYCQVILDRMKKLDPDIKIKKLGK